MTAAGIVPRTTRGGSTPSLAATGEGLTETRPGVYVFNDAQQWELGACVPEQIALTCHATVVSHAGGRLVLDAGSKVLGADKAAWASGFGRLLDHPQARIVLLSEHHAVAAVREIAGEVGGQRRFSGTALGVGDEDRFHVPDSVLFSSARSSARTRLMCSRSV